MITDEISYTEINRIYMFIDRLFRDLCILRL